MTTILVLGGTRSGKSAHAERLAAAAGREVCYVATGSAGDAEMADRIARHRARRPAAWQVVETTDLDEALRRADPAATVLVDDLDGWLLHHMTALGLWTDEDVADLGPDDRAARDRLLRGAEEFWAAANRRDAPTIVTAGQPGWGPTPLGATMRRWLDLHGDVLQRLSATADRVDLVVAGRATTLGPPASGTDSSSASPETTMHTPRVDRSTGSADSSPIDERPPVAHPDPLVAHAPRTADRPPRSGDADVADSGWGRDADPLSADRLPGSGDDVGPTPDLLALHGDRQVPAGAVDLAVNVLPGPPAWLRERLIAAVDDLAAYPDEAAIRQVEAALATAHGRPAEECLLLHGAAEGMWLLPAALRPRLAACIHPSFTEPERALHAAGVPVQRVHRRADAAWVLDVADVPADADLVVLGRPDNPTGVVDPVEAVRALCRPDRIVVVDEAFADFMTGGADLAGRRDLPGLLVLRSLTKLWGLAGLRVGHLLGPPELLARFRAVRQPWPVSTLALAAARACAGAAATAERRRRVTEVYAQRTRVVRGLEELPGVQVWAGPTNFVLLRSPLPDLRDRLLEHGLAVRRGDTFPGLDAHHVRIAVRDAATTARLLTTLESVLA